MHTSTPKRKYLSALSFALVLMMMAWNNKASASLVASFSASSTQGCIPMTVQFTNTSTGASTYYWDLGNGNTSSLQNPSNVFTSAGTFTIMLVAIDAAGNRDTARYVNYITVLGKPSANFSCATTSSCLDNNSFTFNNSSTGAVSYLWDFGDGTTSAQANPVHTFAMSGTFTINLIATNTYGCQDIKTLNQYITIFPKPQAIISVTPTVSCDPSTVFQYSCNSPGITNWYWMFGDATISMLASPSHTYPAPGVYGINLFVSNSFGCKDTADSITHVKVGVQGGGTISSNVDSGCVPLTVTFQNQHYNVVNSFWDFGDGTTSTQYNPTHTYTTAGVYSVSMIATNVSGCVDSVFMPNYIFVGEKPTVSFTFSNSTGCAPLTVSFTNTSSNFVSCQWNFGDGSSSTATNPVHTYTNGGVYSVSLKCWGPTGCTKGVLYPDIVTATSTQALFTASNRIGCPPLNVDFSSFAPGNGLSYHWDFGDGATSNIPNPSHTYTGSGNYDVFLVVSDTLGCSDTIRKISYIRTTNTTANYIPPPTTTGCAPLTAQFTDATAGAISWSWNFGDGVTSNLQNPVHTYSTPGFYTVSLTTTSAGGGCAQTISNFSSFDVHGGYAGFTNTVSPCPPYVATFVDTSLNAVSWLWDFGDGTTSTSQNPVHSYATPGYHSVSLAITTADGCSYSTIQNNGVYFSPFGAHFFGLPIGSTFPMPVQFYANSIGATAWEWDFGDSTTSTLENPMHVYQAYGNYDVSLMITNGVCTLYYNPPPFNFGLPDTTPIYPGDPPTRGIQQGCAPLAVTFTNLVPGSVTWNWDFGDGTSSTSEFPMHTYYNAGIYNVTLTTTDTLGLTSIFQMDSIIRVAGPRAGFIVSPTASCASTEVAFIDTSTNAISWRWDFGDGFLDSIHNSPIHTYTTGMPNYVITQTVTDTMGCTSAISTSVFSSFVSPLIASESEICGYDTVDFFTSMQNYPNYQWDFGDGTYSNSVSPKHVYNQEGVYHVSLTITDSAGCVQTFMIDPPINVNLPVADFSTQNARQGCNRLNILFQDHSTNAEVYMWDFGDGNTSLQPNPVHSYVDAGKYDVTLTIYSGSCKSVKTFPEYIEVDTAYANFQTVYSGICMPMNVQCNDLSANAVSWSWSFGTGDSSTVQNPSYIFTHYTGGTIQLAIEDIHGCRDTATEPPLFTMAPGFTADLDSGCIPMTVQFTNKSFNAANYLWDFGDGTTSTAVSPSHDYNNTGDYTVTLIVTAAAQYGGCTDTLVMTNMIHARRPHADFASPDLYACAPSLVNFADSSADGDSYLWDFGDGTTSTNANPSHIYNYPGTYSVNLILRSNAGCIDTMNRPNYIHVMGPITNCTANAYEGCEPFDVAFTDLSQNAVQWDWNFGDGYVSTIQNATHTYRDTGIFTVSLVTRDTAGCSSYFELPRKILVHPSPVANFQTLSVSGCQPFTATFQNLSTGYDSLFWNFADGNTTTVTNPVHTFNNAGSYPVILYAQNNYGCKDTFRIAQPLNVLPVPVPSFSSGTTEACPPFVVDFVNSSISGSGATYLWDFGNGQTSASQNPQYEFTNPGFYDISLTITNSNGCSATASYPAYIHVLDTVPPPPSRVWSVSVTSNTSVKITWENNPAIDLQAYVIYRYNPFTTYYDVIHTISNIHNVDFSLDPTYTDTGLNTLRFSYTYKVQSVDMCGRAIPLDQLTAHTTINVSSAPLGNDIFVNWTPYGGCPVSSYKIYRCEPGSSFQYLTTVPGDSLNYLDTTFDCPLPYSYKILGTDLCGNPYESYSDTSQTIPFNTLADQVVDVIRSTVVDNDYVLTEWKQPVVHPEKVARFDIYRSTDDQNFAFQTSVPSVQTDYIDHNVDVQNLHYYYKILVINTCDIDEDLSTNTSTILLKGEMDETRLVHLHWSPYKGWDQGVEFYILEKQDENGNWQFLKQVDGETNSYEDQQ